MRTGPRLWIPALLAAALIVVAIGGSIAAALALERIEHDSHTLRGEVSRVIVGNDTGDVQVRATSDDHVTIRETRHSAMSDPEMTAELRDGILRIDVECSGFMTFRCSDDVEVLVPETVRTAAIVVDSGDVAVTGLDGDTFAIETDSGDVTAQGTRGTLDLQADSGDVTADDVEASEVTAETDSGDVTLAFTATPIDVAAEADSGDVEVAVPAGRYRVETTTDSGDETVEGVTRDDSSANRVVASTDSGDVAIRAR